MLYLLLVAIAGATPMIWVAYIINAHQVRWTASARSRRAL
jgi:hypothetical protein